MNSDPVIVEYDRFAHRYDRRWSFYVNATVQETIDRLNLNSDERILDLGCGTGTLIERLLELSPAVEIVGLDPSAEMLNVARQKLPKLVELQVGSADNIPFPDESFDRVISTSAFHYFRHPDRSIQEAKRVLKPNGRLVITDWCDDYLTCRVLDVFLRLFDRAHFRTYSVSECLKMLRDERFVNVSIEKYKIDWFWGMMTATATKEAISG
jgi:ubiquinone/menaquinone biosynthesis C-methylase UbiE